jgi:hypothetical protein
MSSIEVKCAVGQDYFCIEVPTGCSVSEVLKKASEQKDVRARGLSLWSSEVELNSDERFAGFFEPAAVYHVKLGGGCPEGTLLKATEAKLKPLGVDLAAPKLLMEMDKLEWSMEEFLKKAGDIAPTLVVIKLRNGTECGGVAGVPWPKIDKAAGDAGKDSFLFSLGATPTRFELVKPKSALYCTNWDFGFGYISGDLVVWSDGRGCGSRDIGDYAGPREKGQLVGGTAEASQQLYERWELWRL